MISVFQTDNRTIKLQKRISIWENYKRNFNKLTKDELGTLRAKRMKILLMLVEYRGERGRFIQYSLQKSNFDINIDCLSKNFTDKYKTVSNVVTRKDE